MQMIILLLFPFFIKGIPSTYNKDLQVRLFLIAAFSLRLGPFFSVADLNRRRDTDSNQRSI